ncbi:MAG: C1 family peptidase [Candidatus Electrothrix aestuarii]|uniref:C1 family peptidase n=1 Tax=Candidatus Electrothrix aestuarii TaxID=3062594 RepID=A0AAU8LUX8_9BACT
MKKLNRRTTIFALVLAFCFTCLTGPGFAKSQKPKSYPLGDIPLPKEIYKKHLKLSAMDMAGELPASYDARKDGIVTSAKNQGSCGSCWAFASVGAMESHLLRAYNVGPEDLSEQQQVSCNTAMWGCSGGSANAIRFWEGDGPSDEDYFPYTASDTTTCINEEGAQLNYRVTGWHTVAEADFKNSLYTYGPSYWRYTVHGDFYTYWNYGQPGEVYINTAADVKGGHAVLLIGWDDSKQAYLCKNSWGEFGGPNGDGTFWIAYSGHANDLGFGMANFSLTSLACSSDAECDDGVYCNGQETCNVSTGACEAGTAITCGSDGSFCNGEEVCNEATQSCGSTGDPCGLGTVCDEAADFCASLCGNGVCDAGENCSSCPSDCIGGTAGGTCGGCFKGKCDDICQSNKEDYSCSDCWSSYCCGDGTCEGEENSTNCAIDCPVPVCGDGVCDAEEDNSTCPADCPVAAQEICDNGLDDDSDGAIDCADSDCFASAACQCGGKNAACQSGSECCSNVCRNGKCAP